MGLARPLRIDGKPHGRVAPVRGPIRIDGRWNIEEHSLQGEPPLPYQRQSCRRTKCGPLVPCFVEDLGRRTVAWFAIIQGMLLYPKVSFSAFVHFQVACGEMGSRRIVTPDFMVLVHAGQPIPE